MNPQQRKFVSPRAVDLAMRILGADGIKQAYYLEYLMLHFPHGRALAGLEWLFGRGIRGNLLSEFIAVQCRGQALEFCKQVFAGVDRDRDVKPIYARDLRHERA